MTGMKTIDCRGMACPHPVLATRAALAGAGGSLVVLVDAESSCINVQRFAESQGGRVSVAQRDGVFALSIEPGAGGPVGEAPAIACDVQAAPPDVVVYVSSEGMGRGDETLGATLMAAFLDTLAHLKGRVSHLVFVNAGAKLAAAGSPVLEQVRQLEHVGVQVLVCGTCLNFFGIKDSLAVGRVSNMLEIIETLAAAGKVIRP
jgi:selenium metabolism protein YedF